MKKYKAYHKILVCISPFILFAILYFTARFVIENCTLPPCFTYYAFGIQCPGCGITRSIIALVNGDILLSIRQNVYVLLIIVIGLMFYIEFALKIFVVPRSGLIITKTVVDWNSPFQLPFYLYLPNLTISWF